MSKCEVCVNTKEICHWATLSIHDRFALCIDLDYDKNHFG